MTSSTAEIRWFFSGTRITRRLPSGIGTEARAADYRSHFGAARRSTSQLTPGEWFPATINGRRGAGRETHCPSAEGRGLSTLLLSSIRLSSLSSTCRPRGTCNGAEPSPRRSPPAAQSARLEVTWVVTSKLTASVILELASLPVTQAVTLTVRWQRGSCDFASRFRPASAASEAAVGTTPRSLIPPSQPRREGSASGVGKNRQTLVGRGGASSDKPNFK